MSVELIKLRVYLEGIYLPIWAKFSCASQNGPVSTAQLIVPASNKLKPEQIVRAKLHVFWSDRKIRSSTSVDQWPLLWEGDLSGDGQSKGYTHRHMTLNFKNYYTYFEQIMLYFVMKNKANINVDPLWASVINMFYGLEMIKWSVDNSVLSQESRLVTRMKQRANELQPGTDSSSGYVEALMEFLRESTVNTNDYYQQVTNKLRLTGRFAMFKDPDLADLIKAEEFTQLVGEQIGSAPSLENVISFITRILDLLQYKIIFIPNPKFHKEAKEDASVATSVVIDPVASKKDDTPGLIDEPEGGQLDKGDHA